MLKRRLKNSRTRFITASSAAIMTALTSGPAMASYVGDSFLIIPDSPGHWNGGDHKGWIRAEANDWAGRLPRLNSGATDPLAGDKLYFGGPNAPKPGNFGKLVVSLGKSNPDLPMLMRICASKAEIPVLTYAESSDRARPVLEFGARPAEFPAWWEYHLKNVTISDCPVLEGAEQQALVLSFKSIEWLNYDPAKPMANKIVPKPEDIPDAKPAVATPGKGVRSWLVTWIAPATTTTDDQCPKMNAKPSEAEVFRYLTPEEAAALHKRFGDKGVTYGSDSENRGPHRLSVGLFPAIVPDPGLFEPQTNVALGMDLDGNDGKGSPPRGIRRHVNFNAPDGRTGIDNQYFRVMGCIPGMRGRRGYNNQTPNARRADGNIVTILQVSDIDNDQNDDHIEFSLIHSMDKPMRDAPGKTFIPNYSFRPSEDPNFTLYNYRLSGRIVNGVIETDPVPMLPIHPGQGALTQMHNARWRLEPQADGSVKAYLGGYVEWKKVPIGSGYSEGLFNYSTPAVYYALKRNADGLRNPVTGEYDGISTIYEVDTVPAFLVPGAPKVAQSDATSKHDN